VSQEKLDGEWVEFEWLGGKYFSNGESVVRSSDCRAFDTLHEDHKDAYHQAKAKSTQSVDRISEERDLLRKALEGAVWSLEKLLEGSSEETVCGWVACVADLKQAREVLALTKSERGEKE
jgi:hypothetical protein